MQQGKKKMMKIKSQYYKENSDCVKTVEFFPTIILIPHIRFFFLNIVWQKLYGYPITKKLKNVLLNVSDPVALHTLCLLHFSPPLSVLSRLCPNVTCQQGRLPAQGERSRPPPRCPPPAGREASASCLEQGFVKQADITSLSNSSRNSKPIKGQILSSGHLEDTRITGTVISWFRIKTVGLFF